MHAWVSFINKTKYKTIYLQTEEERPGIMLLHNVPSQYIYTSAGTVSADIFSPSGIKLKTTTFSVHPAKLQTVTLR